MVFSDDCVGQGVYNHYNTKTEKKRGHQPSFFDADAMACSTASIMNCCIDFPAPSAAFRHSSFVPFGTLTRTSSVFSFRYFIEALFCASVYLPPTFIPPLISFILLYHLFYYTIYCPCPLYTFCPKSPRKIGKSLAILRIVYRGHI